MVLYLLSEFYREGMHNASRCDACQQLPAYAIGSAGATGAIKLEK